MKAFPSEAFMEVGHVYVSVSPQTMKCSCVLRDTSTRRFVDAVAALSAKFSHMRTTGFSTPPHIQYICCFSVGKEHSTPKQSILDAPKGTHQANGCRLDPVPSHPCSIYKTGLAYNEKHYLPPGHITLPAADGGVMECGPKNDPITQIVFLLGSIVYHGAVQR